MDKKTYTGLTKQTVTVAPYSTTRIDYNDTKPNYYRVQNLGKGTIYCGTSHIPTVNNYDFLCYKESIKMYAEPFNRNALYIYNPTGSEISVIVLSFSAEFDPLTLALSEINLDLSAQEIALSTNISSFESPLPTGNNTIGSIHIVGNALTKLDEIKTALENGAGGSSDYSSIITAITNLQTALQNKDFSATLNADSVNIDNSEVIGKLDEIYQQTEYLAFAYDNMDRLPDDMRWYNRGTSFHHSESFTQYDYSTTAGPNKINFFANDGTTDIEIYCLGKLFMIVKPNEVVNDVIFDDAALTIKSINGSGAFRMLVYEAV